MTNEQMFVKMALAGWETWVSRTGKLFDSLSDEEMLAEIAPRKNRPIYLLGHLIAVNDAMTPSIRLGEGSFAHLREAFIEKPDRSAVTVPSTQELRRYWMELNEKLTGLFAQLTPGEWLERHALVSEEDFAKEPHRNRLGILLSRTSHVSYHYGQLKLIVK